MSFSMNRWMLALAITSGLCSTVAAQTAPLPEAATSPFVTAPSASSLPVASGAPLTPKVPAAPPVPMEAPAPMLASVQTPVPMTAPTNPYYAADATSNAELDHRIAKLEAELKKKQDKPDAKKAFTRVIDGRVFFDSYNVMNQDGADPVTADPRFSNLHNWNGVRDLRLGVKGEGFDILDYKIDLSFVQATGGSTVNGSANNAAVNFKDVWLGVKNVPLFEYVKIGNYRVEDGVANLTGAPNTTFMEFDGVARDFAMSRRLGISTRHLWMQDRVRFFAGMFFEDDLVSANRFISNRDNQGTVTNLRLTYMPYASRGKDGKIDGKRFMMFGGNYSYVDVTRKGSSASSTFTSRFAQLNIGNVYQIPIYMGNYHKFGLEFVAQNGPLALQAEMFLNAYDQAAMVNLPAAVRADRNVFGAYAEVRYFLTGDYRKFSADSAAWSGVDARHNLDLRKRNDCNYACWLGAWEVAARWGYTDLTDLWEPGDVPGMVCGDVHDATLGLNWYWSTQARWMFQYSHVMPNQIRDGLVRDASTTDILAVSFRYHF